MNRFYDMVQISACTLAILSFLYGGQAHADWWKTGDDWSPADTKRQMMWTSMHVLDWSQTLRIDDDPTLKEGNPILGEYPSDGRVNTYFLITGVGHYLVSKNLSPRARKWWQWTTFVVAVGVVKHNSDNGLSVRLEF